MNIRIRSAALALLMLFALLILAGSAEAQGRSGRARATVSGDVGGVAVDVTFSVGERETIREYYTTHSVSSAEGLPPGIRKNLARGKPLPPGIAKKVAPQALVSRISVPRGYEVVEVGWDVLLVEAATGVIHDVLMDAIR